MASDIHNLRLPFLGRVATFGATTALGLVLCLAFLATGCATPSRRIPTEEFRGYQPYYSHLVNYVSDYLRSTQCASGRDSSGRDLTLDFIKGLGETRDGAALPGLLYMLNRPDTNYYYVPAAMALGRIGAPAVFLPLKEAIDAGRLSLADGVIAMSEAARAGNEEALHYVIGVLREGQDVEARLAAAGRALQGDGPRPMWALRRMALEDAVRSDPSMRVRVTAACNAIGRGSKENYWPLLRNAAASKDADVRLQLAKSLSLTMELDNTVPLYLQLLTDEEPAVVAAAWEVLEPAFGEGRKTPGGLRVEYSWPPQDAESARIMAEVYRKAWNASCHK